MIELRPYQREAVEWFRDHSHGILGDEPGLGKTYPAIEAAIEPVLVVAPKYLGNHWQQALEDMGIDMADVSLVDGTPAQKERLIEAATKWTIISYNLLAQTSHRSKGGARYKGIMDQSWGTVIFDEAHRLRGRASMWTRQALRLKATAKLLLTGSPMYHNPGDIFSLLRVCDPKKFSNWAHWRDRYCYTYDDGWKPVVYALRDNQTFYNMLSPYLLRRRYQDVENDLPPQMPPAYIVAPLAPRSRKTYRESMSVTVEEARAAIMEGRAMRKTNMVETRGIVARDPNKLEALTQLLSDLNERVVVFTYYVETAAMVARELDTHLVIHGKTRFEDRLAMLDALQSDPNAVLVATMGVLGEGWNLQHTSKVVFYEEHYVQEAMNQAIRRFHRTGQSERVQVYYIQSQGTIDAKIHRVANDTSLTIQEALLE